MFLEIMCFLKMFCPRVDIQKMNHTRMHMYEFTQNFITPYVEVQVFNGYPMRGLKPEASREKSDFGYWIPDLSWKMHAGSTSIHGVN